MPQPHLTLEYGGWDQASSPLQAPGGAGGVAAGAMGAAMGTVVGASAGATVGREPGAALAAARASTPPFGPARLGTGHHYHHHQSQKLLQFPSRSSPQLPAELPRHHTGDHNAHGSNNRLAQEADSPDAYFLGSNAQLQLQTLQLHTLNTSVGDPAGVSVDGVAGWTSSHAGRVSAVDGRLTADGAAAGMGDFPMASSTYHALQSMDVMPAPRSLQANVQSALQVSGGGGGGPRVYSHLALGTGVSAYVSSGGTTGGTGAMPSPAALQIGPAGGSVMGGAAANAGIVSGPNSAVGMGALPRLLDMTFKTTMARVPSRARTPGGASGQGPSNVHSGDLFSSGQLLLSSSYGATRAVHPAAGGSVAGPRASVGGGGEGALSTGLSLHEHICASGADTVGGGGGAIGSTPHAPQVARVSDMGELWSAGPGSGGPSSWGAGSGTGSKFRVQGGGGGGGGAWVCVGPSGTYEAAGSAVGSPSTAAGGSAGAGAGGGGGMGAGGGRLASRHSSRSNASRFRTVVGAWAYNSVCAVCRTGAVA